ncbi:MAG: CapA family protein [Dehalococcoidia bacterium]|nr:MAG: CapA family protein [Dehalococcoidia bacterium]
MAVGDISLQTRNNKHPFKNVKQIFESKEILFGNLETVLSNRGEKRKKAVLLYSSPENVKYLKEAGFDVLNVANNHIMDLDVEGFINTLNILNQNDLNFIGANNGNYIILERNGITLGFLGYTRGRFKVPQKSSINKLEVEKIVADVESIKDKCDFIVVSLHWGSENVSYPSPKQIKFAHNLIDQGATLILGHHPHVIQGIEEYKDGLIAYSLGNFQFNPKLSQSKTNNSIILCVELTKEGIKNYEIIPIVIDDDFLPTPIKGQGKDELLHFISKISRQVSDGEMTNKWWFEEIAETYLSSNMNSYINKIKRYGFFHLLECIVWLATPFCIRCYAGIIRQRFKAFLKTGKK